MTTAEHPFPPPTGGDDAPGSPEAPPDGPAEVADSAVLDELSLVFGDDEADPARPGPVAATDAAGDDEEPDAAAGGSESPAGDVEDDVHDDVHDDAPDDGHGAAVGYLEEAPPASAPGGPDAAGRGPRPRPVLVDPGLQAVARRDDGTEPSAADDATTGEGHTIRIGDDQDLPDAVYLDEELERAGSPGHEGPIFIDDDDTGDAIVASEATGRTVDTRIRQRRITVRRAEGRRRLRWLLVVAVVVVAVVAVLGVLASSLFAINEVKVTGNRYTDPEALKAVISELDGTPVLIADTKKYEEQLEAIPWVEDARVRTSFPNSASIDIRERVPVAAMPGADGLTRVLDKEGRVLDTIEGQPIALVWISGPITLDIPAGHFASPGPTWAAALVPKFTPTIRPRVDSMQVTPDGSDLRIYLRPTPVEATADDAATPDTAAGDAATGDTATGDDQPSAAAQARYVGPLIEVRFGSAIGDGQQIEKLVRLERVLTDLDTSRVSVIDVSTSEVTVL